ncbi:unnamed protein product [Candidula unifasciata]|uniref:Myogenesis-regulating glycosidase n=1 Tax=Candidula unifasciata TaxID=100452 RepID=A0A8S3YV68_9EUPU|nr:unnamed protein product [Candidula unifasciata]
MDSNNGHDDDTAPITAHILEKKRRKRRALKIGLYIIAGIVALGVFSVWLLHKDSIEAIRFGQGFLLSVKLRSLEIKNQRGENVLYGDLGSDLLATPYDHCWDITYEFYEDSCLQWRDKARLKVIKDDNLTSPCYTFHWEGLVPDFTIEDCFYLQGYSWYGYVTNTTDPWPILDLRLEERDYSKEYPLEQTEHIVPIWFGSQGVVIFVDSGHPFGISWNHTDKRQLCISSKPQQQVYFKPLNVLHYTVCQGKSIKDVYTVSRRHRLQKDTHAFSEQNQQQHIMPNPIYAIPTKEELPQLLDLMRRNESQCSLIELFDDWEGEYGNLSVDASISELLQDVILEAANQDCYLVLPVSPFFSYKSQHFKEGISKNYFIRDRQNLVTRMVKWRDHEGAVLDVSNSKALDWFVDHIRELIDHLGVISLKLLTVTLPPDSRFLDFNVSQLDYPRLFHRAMSTLNISLTLEFTSGFITAPVYIPIHMNFFKNSGYNCLNTSIPYSLVMGLSGYPLLTADIDEMVSSSTTDEMLELWIKVAIFFPQLKIPCTQLFYNNTMQELLQEALDLRSITLLPYLSQVWQEDPHLPIIRPMWWISPDDPVSRSINDQFLVGDKMLVAPVLCERTQRRVVYLPKGTWRGDDMKLIKGPKTIEVNVIDSNIALYFWREDSGNTESNN